MKHGNKKQMQKYNNQSTNTNTNAKAKSKFAFMRFEKKESSGVVVVALASASKGCVKECMPLTAHRGQLQIQIRKKYNC